MCHYYYWVCHISAVPTWRFHLAVEANSFSLAAAQGVTHATSLIQVMTSRIFLTSQKRGFAIPSCEVPWMEDGLDVTICHFIRAFWQERLPKQA